MKKTILIVEDDPDIQEMLQFSLEDNGYQLLQANTAHQAWLQLENETVNLVLLDWRLPDLEGIELLRRIRKKQIDLPVIMLTARGEEEDRVLGLDVGADDYMVKPFSVAELKARIRALLRRTYTDEYIVTVGELSVDPSCHRVNVAENTLELSPIEFRLLHFLMIHPDRVYTRDQLLDHIWGDNVYIQERTVDVHIRRLRKTLSPYKLEHLIETVHGTGYRFAKIE
ncbi:MAG: phosphate regulon transcriptional regulator PhoB [Thiotrichaceae bacterium]|nr:phosphate regulon transcriptional regulator PhoB [Thiotrichaceae bacterium]